MTVAALWRELGEEDPFGSTYVDGPHLRVAGADYPNGSVATMALTVDGRNSIVELTIIKDRLRYLSRRLIAMGGDQSANNSARSKLKMGDRTDDCLANTMFIYGDGGNDIAERIKEATHERIIWLSNLLEEI